jgi:hypothetical protein
MSRHCLGFCKDDSKGGTYRTSPTGWWFYFCRGCGLSWLHGHIREGNHQRTANEQTVEACYIEFGKIIQRKRIHLGMTTGKIFSGF